MKGQAQVFSRSATGGTDDWSTPQDFYDLLNEEFSFELDPCATADNAKCALFIPPEVNGLAVGWGGKRVFCNPPYGDVKAWAEKCVSEAQAGSLVVLLVPARTDTAWFQAAAQQASQIRFVKGRLKFGDGANSAPFPSAVLVLPPERVRRPLQVIFWNWRAR